MRSLHDVAAPAKLNLFLHVTGRRADGYHLLQSAFVLLDWHDTLHFERRPGGKLSREDLGAALPADDLVLRAARALQQHAGTTEGAHIAIDKRLPAEAGLGGGSSDAASCLLALNRLWSLKLPLPALEQIGLQLGADVPFFHLRQPRAETGQRQCYNLGLCCKPLGLRSQRPGASGPAALPRSGRGGRMAGFARLECPHDGLRQRGLRAAAAGHRPGAGASPLGPKGLGGAGMQPKLVKALDFDSSMRGFESFLPCQTAT
ncbi:MAG: 4-(cytidine 5-diphospho)-2-C-methyl-D-erythritol kinase [Ramlibacter sp.]|nr:4-(cytidine 5-diphospho)-2-C-methyl-D-erythritol kinase [Ramlibacter sp.]